MAENSLWLMAGLCSQGRIGLASGPAGITVFARATSSLAELMPFKDQEEILVATIRERYGVDLPRAARRVQGSQFACTWAGGRRWLLETEATLPEPDAIEDLERSIAGIAALVRQTDGRSMLRVSGPKVREVLRKGVTIDLHPRSFSAGDTAITLVAGMDVHLWQVDDLPTYDLLISRSVTGSFWGWLTSAAAEFGLECATKSIIKAAA